MSEVNCSSCDKKVNNIILVLYSYNLSDFLFKKLCSDCFERLDGNSSMYNYYIPAKKYFDLLEELKQDAMDRNLSD